MTAKFIDGKNYFEILNNKNLNKIIPTNNVKQKNDEKFNYKNYSLESNNLNCYNKCYNLLNKNESIIDLINIKNIQLNNNLIINNENKNENNKLKLENNNNKNLNLNLNENDDKINYNKFNNLLSFNIINNINKIYNKNNNRKIYHKSLSTIKLENNNKLKDNLNIKKNYLSNNNLLIKNNNNNNNNNNQLINKNFNLNFINGFYYDLISFNLTTTFKQLGNWLIGFVILLNIIGCCNAGFACLSNPCIFGVCIDGLNSSYSCYCIDGYTGVQCQTNWDECWSSPCINGGTCIDGVAYYNCTCPEGFSGINCEENVDECLSNPCQNGGLCKDRDNGYECTCQPGYLGTHCEVDVAVCETGNGARCHNGGECIEGPGLTFDCKCAPGWRGRICQYEINECESSPCQNGGVCVDKLAQYVCACPMGYTGTNCEEEILICSDNPCKNNALCLMEEGVPTCYCVPDYHGEKCEFQYDECQLGPKCMNGGVCIDGVDTFTCSCPPMLTGLLCECLMLDDQGNLNCNYTAPPTTTQRTTTTTTQEITTESKGIEDTFKTDPQITSGEDTTEGDISIESTLPTWTDKSIDTFSTISIDTTVSYDTTQKQHIGPTTVTISIGTIDSDNLEGDKTTEQHIGIIDVTTFKPFYPFPPNITMRPIDLDTTLLTTYLPPPISTVAQIPTATDIPKKHYTTEKTYTLTSESSTIENDIITIVTEPQTTYWTPKPTHYPTMFPGTDFTTQIGILPTGFPHSRPTTFFTDEPGMQWSTHRPTSIPPIDSTSIPLVSDDLFTYRTTIDTTTPVVKSTPIPTSRPIPTTTIGVYNATIAPDCVKTGCYNGGTCVTTSEGSRCVCRFDRQGALCEQPIIIQNAAFAGDSYVSHRIHTDIQRKNLNSVLPMQIELKVRTRATNGLIMLAAAQGTKGGHYMALFLQKGLLQFQFSCGLQTMLLSELETPVNTGNEITIRAELDFSRNYTHCNASLLVNDTLAMSGDQPTWLKLLPSGMHTSDIILNTWLHLGGAPQAPIGLIIELPPAQNGAGFTGCLHSLKINSEEREIFGDALDGFGITECGSLACLSSPCRNGAACVKVESNEIDENGQKQEKWQCKCTSGYMGPTCDISVCEDNPCQYGGTCVQFPGSGYLCLCPLGKHGHYCEHNLEVALPSFSGSVNGLSSFVAYTVPIPLEYSLELSFKILPQTMSQISLLAFLGQAGYHDERSDHLAISFIQGYIMLTWNLGSGPRRIFTQKPIDFRLDAPRIPYEIRIGRIGRQAWLSVDGKFNITGRSPGSVSRMDVLPVLYLGGHEISNFNTLPHDLPLHSGFQGCIYDVNLKAGQVTVPLQETRGVRGRGVGQCGTRECHRHACQNDGACLQHGATFTCICQEGWYGPLCAQPINPCDSFNNKCGSDATCVPLVNGYECDCPVGKTGKNCEEDIQSLSDVSLTGRRSYLAVRWPYLNSDRDDKVGAKRSQIVAYRNFTKKVMPKPIAYSQAPNQHFVMKLLNEVEKQRNFSPLPLMAKTIEEHHRVQFFFIEFQMRPLSEKGLLLYFGTLNTNQDNKIGFVSLSLQGGVVEFRISGPNNHVTIVRSVRMLAVGEWHKIKMAQRGRWLTLWVEGSASSALAPSAEVLVEQDSMLYIGGLKDLSKLPHNAVSGYPVPFRGCVRGLVVSGTRIVLNESSIVESRNIRDCDGTACGGDSCESGGHCWLDEKLQPHCICPEYAKGGRCEYSETCKLIPCKNNGRCLRSGRCSCPNGWGGFYCEIAMEKPTTPSFRGNSYLVLPPPRIPNKDKRKGPSVYLRPRQPMQIALNFSTIEPNGLLLWSEHDDQTKFLGLGFEDGHIKIASNLLENNNSTIITSGGFVSDGGWHSCKIVRDRGFIELILDGELIFSERTNQNFILLNNYRNLNGSNVIQRGNKDITVTYENEFYLGGFPNSESIAIRTKNRFNKPFKGCIQDVTFGSEPLSQITDFSPYQGENIGSCDLHDNDIIV